MDRASHDSGGEPGRMHRFGPWLALAVHALFLGWFLLASPHSRWDLPLDDAWIHQVYARSLAAGEGFAYNPGQQEAGATSPLWALATAPAHWLPSGTAGAEVVFGVKAIGVSCSAWAVWMLWGLAHRLTRSAGAATLGAALWAVDPRLAFSALSGMENSLLVALWLMALDALLAGKPARAVWALGLAPLVRPEAALLVPFGLAALAWVHGLRSEFWRQPWTWIALAGPGLVWASVCRAISGSWLPNSFHVKAGAQALDSEIWGTAWHLLTQQGWASAWLFVPGLGLATVWAATRRGKPERIGVLGGVAGPLLYLGAVVGSRSVQLHGYYWTRWADPAVLWLTAAVAIAAAGFAFGPKRWGPLVAAVGLALALPAWFESSLERRARLASDGRAIRALNVRAGQWVDRHLPPDAVVGVNDAGALRYFGNRRTLDLIGLNYGDLLHGRVTPPEVLADLDALAVFPTLFPPAVRAPFTEQQLFQIPPEEYTICRCPQQAQLWIGLRP